MTTTETTMKAWGQTKYGDSDVLEVVEVPIPTPKDHDLLIKVHGAAMNCVDYKKSGGAFGKFPDEFNYGPMIVGYDGSGTVTGVGPNCSLFKVGDEVYFAGVLNRPGCFAEYTLVDERIVGHKPHNLSFADASAVPLCALAVYEGMVEGLGIEFPGTFKNVNAEKSILITAGAGGVGSLGIQFAKKILKFGKVIGTASREESIEFCKKMGADLVIDHEKPYTEELQRLGIQNGVDYIYNCTELYKNATQLGKIIRPLGKICSLIGASKPCDLMLFEKKRVTLAFEFMFTKPYYGINMESQHEILEQFGQWIDEGLIDPRVTNKLEFSKLPEVFNQQRGGHMVGKTVFDVHF